MGDSLPLVFKKDTLYVLAKVFAGPRKKEVSRSWLIAVRSMNFWRQRI